MAPTSGARACQSTFRARFVQGIDSLQGSSGHVAATTSLNLSPKCHPDLDIMRVEFVALTEIVFRVAAELVASFWNPAWNRSMVHISPTKASREPWFESMP